MVVHGAPTQCSVLGCFPCIFAQTFDAVLQGLQPGGCRWSGQETCTLVGLTDLIGLELGHSVTTSHAEQGYAAAAMGLVEE